MFHHARRTRFKPFATLFCIAASALGAATPVPTVNQSQIAANYGNLPLAFEANQGQADSGVRFLSRGNGYSLFLTDSAAILALGQPSNCKPDRNQSQQESRSCAAGQDVIQMTILGSSKLSKLSSPHSGASSPPAQPRPTGEEELPGKSNYIFGNDPAKWRTGLSTYGKVRYAQVYPGIDLVYYGNRRQLEYDFVVAPGANPTAIRLAFAGQKRWRLAANGDLLLEGRNGKATLHKPVLYQEAGGQRRIVRGDFRLNAGNKVSFSIGNYDHAQPLIIDPVLVYSTYIGGSGSDFYYYFYGDQANGIALDSAGSAYIVGTTQSVDFPVTSGAYLTENKPTMSNYGPTAFVSKLNAAGTALVYSTFLGGSGVVAPFLGQGIQGYGDFGYGIALDSANNAYVTGATYSIDFPTTAGTLQTTVPHSFNGNPTGFVTKLSADGASLVYSTYLGGETGESAQAIAVDGAGDAFVAGSTSSANFPVTKGAFQTVNKGIANSVSNAFITELNPAATAEIFSTFLGGSGYTSYPVEYGEQANGIAIDGAGNIYVTGNTASTDFPVTAGAYQSTNRAYPPPVGNSLPTNGFVTKLNPSGSAEIYSTYLGGGPPSLAEGPYGGTLQDSVNALAVDSSGNAYIAGQTYSPNFPLTPGALQTEANPNGMGFVSKLNAAGSALDYSTLLGGGGTGVVQSPYQGGYGAFGIAVNSAGEAVVAGFADGRDFPASLDAIANDLPYSFPLLVDGFVVKLNPSATAAEYSTLLGGIEPTETPNGGAQATAVALDAGGDVYVTGSALPNFQTTSGAFQTTSKTINQGGNAFVSKLALSGETASHFTTQTAIGVSTAQLHQGSAATLTATVTASGGATPTGTVTFLGAGLPSTPVTLNGNGTANWSSSSLAPGAYLGYASYAGDGSHLSSLVFGAPNAASFRVIGPPHAIGNTTGVSYSFALGDFSNLPLTFLVTDSANYPLSGVTVNLSGTGLSFSSPSVVTNASGVATGYFTALQSGSLTASAAVSGIASPTSVPINVTAQTYTLSPASLTFTAPEVGATSAPQTITVSNTGAAAVTVKSYLFTGANAASFVWTGKTCIPSLAAGASCTLSIAFKPTAAGTSSAGLTASPISADSANGPAILGSQTVALSGSVAASPSISLSPTSLTFAATDLGTTAPSQTVTVSNNSSVAASVQSYLFSGAASSAFLLTGKTCTTTLAAGANCTLSIAFKPAATGTVTADLVATDLASNSPQSVTLSGSGGTLSALTLAPSLTFPATKVGLTSAAQTVTVANPNSSAVAVKSYTFAGSNSFVLTGKTCITTLAANASCTLSIAFKPTAAGTATGTLAATDGASGSPQELQLSGTGVAP